MQKRLWNSKYMHNSIKKQPSILYCAQMPLFHETRGQMNIFTEFFNAGENCIAIINNQEVGNKTHGPYIKPLGTE